MWLNMVLLLCAEPRGAAAARQERAGGRRDRALLSPKPERGWSPRLHCRRILSGADRI